eukprot:m.262917 g.262917  ORF g.262917 m.262917 type:complete len:659 (+) comp19702_c0_seq1:219-2195(+)
MADIPFDIGDRVETEAQGVGVVSFVGRHKVKPGDRVGITLDNPTGKNNGTVGGHTYFECKPLHGCLVLPKKVTLIMKAEEYQASLKKKGSKRESKKEKKEKKEKKDKSVKKSKAAVEEQPEQTAPPPAAEDPVPPLPPVPEPEPEPEPPAAEEESQSAPATEASDGGDTSGGEQSKKSWQDLQKERVQKREQEEAEKAEAERLAREEEKLRKPGSVHGMWSPKPEGLDQLSDKEIAERKKNRKSSKHSAFKDEPKRDVVKSTIKNDDAAYDAYLDKMSAQKTLDRKVGGNRKVFEQMRDEYKEEVEDLDDRAALTTGTYIEIAQWTFYNRTSTKQFTKFMSDLEEDDRQPEGFFKVFEVGTPVSPPERLVGTSDSGTRYKSKSKVKPSAAAKEKLHAPDPSVYDTSGGHIAEVSYVSISVGSAQQFIELYQLYDVKKEVNVADNDPDVQSQIVAAARTGLKRVESDIFCNRAPRDMKTVVDDWNRCDFAAYKLHEDAKSSIMGGWRSIVKFLNAATNDHLAFTARLKFEDSAARTAFRQTLADSDKKYKSFASAGGLGAATSSPTNWAIDAGDTDLHIFALQRASIWPKSKPEVQASQGIVGWPLPGKLAKGMTAPSRVMLLTDPNATAKVMKPVLATAKQIAGWNNTLLYTCSSSLV